MIGQLKKLADLETISISLPINIIHAASLAVIRAFHGVSCFLSAWKSLGIFVNSYSGWYTFQNQILLRAIVATSIKNATCQPCAWNMRIVQEVYTRTHMFNVQYKRGVNW